MRELHHLAMATIALGPIAADIEELDAAAMDGETDIIMEEGLIYRAGGFTEQNFTPRDNESLSAFETPETVFTNSTSNTAQVIDTSKLENLQVRATSPPEGHVSITPRTPSDLRGWQQSRGQTPAHPLTQELMRARVGTVRRPK